MNEPASTMILKPGQEDVPVNLIQKETGPHHFQPTPQKLSSVSSKFMYTVQSSCMDSSSQSIQSEVFLLSQVTKRFHTVTLHQDSLLTSRRAGGCADAHRLWQDQSLAACADSCVHHIQTKGTENLQLRSAGAGGNGKAGEGPTYKNRSLLQAPEKSLHYTALQMRWQRIVNSKDSFPEKSKEKVSAFIPPSPLSCSRSSLSIVMIEAD